MILGITMQFRYNTEALIHENIGKLNFSKMKTLCFVKDSITRMRRQATDWKNTFAKDTSQEGPLFKIYKELFKFINKKTNN
jgi:hypothetical protein